ncbi:MAG: GTP 3',8-cyclase MoaA [Bacteroidetes bacterium]|nr:GTP 3',8-cyclase MoaA [Bacteroidota bacterium]
MNQLKDKFNRIHDYLRISLTDKCNLRCSYCNPNDLGKGFFSNSSRMTADEIDQIVSVFVKSGVKKIRLTGGEPLVRKDAKEIILRLSKYPVELAITTNGVFVNEFIDTFKEAGLKSVNVSLDSLFKEKYFSITQRDEFDRVSDNIKLLVANDFHVKVNVVVMKDVNDSEILEFIQWTKDVPVHIRFIEFMPFTGNKWSSGKVVDHQQILNIISSKFHYIKLLNEKNDTAKKYFVPKHKGSFAIISTMSEPFCNGCNRMRLTSEGKMYNCLFAKAGTDLLSALRLGNDIEPLIEACVQGKSFMLGGNKETEKWGNQTTVSHERSMISIGG